MGYEPFCDGIKTHDGGRVYIEATQIAKGIRFTTPRGESFLIPASEVSDLLKALRHAADYIGIEELF